MLTASFASPPHPSPHSRPDGFVGIQPSHVPIRKTTLQAPKYDQEGTLQYRRLVLHTVRVIGFQGYPEVPINE